MGIKQEIKKEDMEGEPVDKKTKQLKKRKRVNQKLKKKVEYFDKNKKINFSIGETFDVTFPVFDGTKDIYTGEIINIEKDEITLMFDDGNSEPFFDYQLIEMIHDGGAV